MSPSRELLHARIPKALLTDIYEQCRERPGYDATVVVTEAVTAYLKRAEGEEVTLPDGSVKEAGAPFPEQIGPNKTGRPSEFEMAMHNFRYPRKALHVTTYPIDAELITRFQNAAFWRGERISYVLQSIMEQWEERSRQIENQRLG